MRRPVGMILVGLGAFCLALAPLMRFYVAEKVVIAPRNFYVSTTLEAANATYFDPALLKLRTGATLQATNTVRADVRAGSDTVAVWDSSTVIKDKGRDKQIDIQDFRIALDRRTSQLINCCGSKVGDDTNVKMSGYGILFPVGDVDKQDYSFFDMTTKQPWPMRFKGEQNVQGLPTYRFVQSIPTTKTAHVGSLPGTLFGLGRKSGPVKADRYFSATITYWVDPRTGIPVKQEERIRNTVTTVDGKSTIEAGTADLVTIAADQKSLIGISNDNATRVKLLRVIVPATALIAGLLLTLIGGVLGLIGGGDAGRRDGRGTGGPSGGASGSGGTRRPAGSGSGTDPTRRQRPPGPGPGGGGERRLPADPSRTPGAAPRPARTGAGAGAGAGAPRRPAPGTGQRQGAAPQDRRGTRPRP